MIVIVKLATAAQKKKAAPLAAFFLPFNVYRNIIFGE
jgi:hypothetical protein